MSIKEFVWLGGVDCSAMKVLFRVCVCVCLVDGVAHDHERAPAWTVALALTRVLCVHGGETKSTTWRDKRHRGTQWTSTRLS